MVKEDEHVVKHTVMGLSMGGVGIRSRAWGRGHAQHGRGSVRGAWEEDECRSAMIISYDDEEEEERATKVK